MGYYMKITGIPPYELLIKEIPRGLQKEKWLMPSLLVASQGYGKTPLLKTSHTLDAEYREIKP